MKCRTFLWPSLSVDLDLNKWRLFFGSTPAGEQVSTWIHCTNLYQPFGRRILELNWLPCGLIWFGSFAFRKIGLNCWHVQLFSLLQKLQWGVVQARLKLPALAIWTRHNMFERTLEWISPQVWMSSEVNKYNPKHTAICLTHLTQALKSLKSLPIAPCIGTISDISAR